jgi:signal recognition particle GTPase
MTESLQLCKFRQNELIEIIDQLSENDLLTKKIVILSGIEGIGKTSLLKKIGVYCQEREFYSEGVFYCCLEPQYNSV